MTSGRASAGRVRLIARQLLSSKTLLTTRGEDSLTKETTPARNWLSQELLRKTLESMRGDAPLPPMAAPYPPEASVLPVKTFRRMTLPAPWTATPAPKRLAAPV